MSRFGVPTVLVAAAGVARASPIMDMTVETWDLVLGANLRGVMLCTQAVARLAAQAGEEGAIVLISSVNGVVADPGFSAYGASKAGLYQFARVAAREFGPLGIRINAVGPGPTETPALAQGLALAGYRDEVIRRTPLGRVGPPGDIAEAVVGLLKFEWVTGQALMADGGSSLNTGRSVWTQMEEKVAPAAPGGC